MTEDEKLGPIASQPTELLLHIFTLVDVKDLIRCRQVCVRWMHVVDSLQDSEPLWRKHCKRDFGTVYQTARTRARPSLTWYHLYRSLTLWPRLATARETLDEIACAETITQEIVDFKVLKDGLIAVQKKSCINYYDIETLEYAKRGSINGNYLRFDENDDVVVILGYQLHLYVVRKVLHREVNETGVSFDSVKVFLLKDNIVYFVNLNEELFSVDADETDLHCQFIQRCKESVICLGYTTHLHLLTNKRHIYSVIDNNIVFVCALDQSINLMHYLKVYNFLEQLDWRVYFQWMYVLNHNLPDVPLRDIVTVRTYGDVIFVGTNYGVLRIYYAPYTAGQMDLFKAEPIKQYNFMDRKDCPVLSDLCPIIQIDVVEGEDGHTVIVAMPKKLALIQYTHTYKRSSSAAMLPYREMNRVKILKIAD